MPKRLFSFDPGAPHVGIAMWEYSETEGRWVCFQAKECTPDEFEAYCKRFTERGLISAMAYEIYRLGGGEEAARQLGSTFPTVECIGIAKHYCRLHGIPITGCERGERRATLKRMRAVGWKFPRGSSDHVKDAIAVGATILEWRAANHIEGDGVRPRSPSSVR